MPVLSTAESKTSLGDEIFSILKARILRWEYPPGWRLPEDELCREFGVSRVPVREALRKLEESSLVEKVPYRGCTVKQPNPAEIQELYDVRLALEYFVGEQLARDGMAAPLWQQLNSHWQDADLAGLANASRTGSIDSIALAQEDERFHESLAAATGNGTLLELLQMINARLRFIRVADITTHERLEQTRTEHLAILAAIQSRDVAATRDAIAANVNGGRQHVQAAIRAVLATAFLNQQA
jgi:DNA-binding GntR family transcriptional regulator